MHEKVAGAVPVLMRSFGRLARSYDRRKPGAVSLRAMRELTDCAKRRHVWSVVPVPGTRLPRSSSTSTSV
jgi:hypothetical protein